MQEVRDREIWKKNFKPMLPIHILTQCLVIPLAPNNSVNIRGEVLFLTYQVT